MGMGTEIRRGGRGKGKAEVPGGGACRWKYKTQEYKRELRRKCKVRFRARHFLVK
jgi:hypothetical protein